ncbi:peptide-N(4)-(N-acetyl-beta-glucosaminyl)asparagine amidase isoform X2 [Leptopilina boulardi]|uniref:peptide-N(4)-(N-acetyl-beta- glucosaminyl)asparagine amidase isoform X2 n=1 Tax=Leptopilina boulardi TaxID=63433 RepID=UPI0021F6691F|nr:peptide-N(4)-(N-acetyl-beta-glucosaminyl)asparagine amidase isoform X2 [Leptopilina boulardi]
MLYVLLTVKKEGNDEKVLGEARFVLTKLCENILNFPTNEKYRKVRLSNPIVMSKLLPASGAIECLFEAGFIETDDGFYLPKDVSLSLIQDLKRSIDNLSSKIVSQEPNCQNKTEPMSRQIFQNSNQTRFFNEIERHFEDVLDLEDKKLQARAKMLIPLEELQIKTMERMRFIQREIKTRNIENECSNIESAEENFTMEDLLLVQLINWFKCEFFKWVNSPPCNVCSNECSFVRVEPSKNPGISRIEIHRCGVCGNDVQFPRYTDPNMLLTTREGRCGEWARVFTLMCRSLGYDTRFIVDKTDHVWTEVWSVAQKRWIHADSCENAMDRPLMYEKGWGKKLSYIIAYSKDEIQDVTWRYTSNPEAVKRERNLCSEESLVAFILELTNRRLHSLSSVRKEYIVKHRLLELVDMLPAPPGCKKVEENENVTYEGRISGSLAWKLARGETQVTRQKYQKWIIPKGTKHYELRYFVVKDIYEVSIENNKSLLETRIGWQEGIAENEGGIFRKEESDWKMVYLARSSDNEFGFISWTFEVNDENLVMSSLKLNALIGTFHSGDVEWVVEKFYLETSETEKIENNSENFEIDLKKAVRINIKAILSGGNGELAWQHAQLFRQSLNSSEKHSMLISISLEKR